MTRLSFTACCNACSSGKTLRGGSHDGTDRAIACSRLRKTTVDAMRTAIFSYLRQKLWWVKRSNKHRNGKHLKVPQQNTKHSACTYSRRLCASSKCARPGPPTLLSKAAWSTDAPIRAATAVAGTPAAGMGGAPDRSRITSLVCPDK